MKAKIAFWLGIVLLVFGLLGLMVNRISQDDSAFLIAGAILVGLSVSRS